MKTAPNLPDTFPTWDDCQENDQPLWAASWSYQHGGPDVSRLNDYLGRNFADWLSGRDSGWMLLGVFPTHDSASHFLVTIGKYANRTE